MHRMRPVQVIAVTSGRGGAGKTSVAVNLSLALAKLGRRVILLDGDLGLSSVNISLGLPLQQTLIDVLEGRCELRDVLLQGPGGIRVVPASSSNQNVFQLTSAHYAGLIRAFSDIDDDLDVLVIDTAAGIGELVVNLVRAAQEVLVVVCDDPVSVANAYSLIRVLNRDYGINRFRVVANRVRSKQQGRSLFSKLTEVTDSSLDVYLHYAGAVLYDVNMVTALQDQCAFSEAYPRSKAAITFNTLARKVNRWPLQACPRGHLEFFVERLVRQSGPAAPGVTARVTSAQKLS
jgi:flagellar biosynthesis protein FlhG